MCGIRAVNVFNADRLSKDECDFIFFARGLGENVLICQTEHWREKRRMVENEAKFSKEIIESKYCVGG